MNTVNQSLIVYFSHSGNTRFVAEEIQKQTGGILLEVKPVTQYPENYRALIAIAKDEFKKNSRPKLTGAYPNLRDFDTVFIGFPNWCNTMPMPLFTFLENNAFSGKSIAPFITHGGGGIGQSLSDIQKCAPGSILEVALSLNGSSVHTSTSQKTISDWILKLKR